MARKKMTPMEEPEQLQPAEGMGQTGDPPEASCLPEAPPDAADAVQEEGPPASAEGREGILPEAGETDVPTDDPPAPGEEAAPGEALPADSEGEVEITLGDPAAASAADEQQPVPMLDLTELEYREEVQPPTLPDAGEGQPREGTSEVLSVDLSGPVEPPDSGGSTPEDLDSLLEDSAVGHSAVSPLPVEETPPGSGLPDSPQPEKSDRQKFFELKFNRLDRNLTPEERQEWNSIYASYRGRSALTGTIIGVDPLSVQVRNPQTGAMEKETMYCAIVVPYRVRIVIPASEMWETDKERPDFVLQNMVGSNIDFIIIKVDREAGFAIGSRRLAARSQRYFFAHRPNLNAVGARLKCRMLSVGPRRCLVECYGHDIGLTQRELRYTAIPDLRDEYHPGRELDCVVKLYDPDTDRLEISVKETEANPFDGAEQRHPVGARRLAMIAGKYGGGVFCNLPDGTVCMCNYSYQHEDSDFLVGDNVMLIVQRFDVEKQQMYGKILTKW